MELTEREAARRLDEQRAKTAPSAATTLSSMCRAQSQPAISPYVSTPTSFSAREKSKSVNYDEMWSHSFALRASEQHDLMSSHSSGKPAKKKSRGKTVSLQLEDDAISPALPLESPQHPTNELQQIAHSNIDMISARATRSEAVKKKTHRLNPTILPRKGQTVDAFNFTS